MLINYLKGSEGTKNWCFHSNNTSKTSCDILYPLCHYEAFSFDLFCCFGFHKQNFKKICLTLLQRQPILRNLQQSLWKLEQFMETFCKNIFLLQYSKQSFGNYLLLGNPLTFCGTWNIQLYARCGFRDKTKLPTKFTLQILVRRIHGNYVSGIHFHFGICLKTCLWIPVTYRNHFVRLSSGQMGIVMAFKARFLTF